MKSLILSILTLFIAVAPIAAFAAPSRQSDIATENIAETAELNVGRGSVELIAAPQRSAHFVIFSITGQAVKSANVDAGERVSIDLPAGYYIVKCADWSRRILIK